MAAGAEGLFTAGVPYCAIYCAYKSTGVPGPVEEASTAIDGG